MKPLDFHYRKQLCDIKLLLSVHSDAILKLYYYTFTYKWNQISSVLAAAGALMQQHE